MKQNLLNPLNPLTILGFFRVVTNAFPIDLGAIRGICPFVALVFKNCPVVGLQEGLPYNAAKPALTRAGFVWRLLL
jgi:hypothetical protein